MGEFWVTSIPALVLLKATVSSPLRLVGNPTKAGWGMAGTMGDAQRRIEETRLKQIAAFIETFDATFPNSIILAAEEEFGEEADGDPWKVETTKGGSTLTIPENPRRA